MNKQVKLRLPADVADWLAAQPDGGAPLVEALVRERMGGADGFQRRLLKVLSTALREVEQDVARTVARELFDTADPRPVKKPAELAPEVEAALQKLDPRTQERARALSRYPQLVEAVVRGLVGIDRAEGMAEEADQRAAGG